MRYHANGHNDASGHNFSRRATFQRDGGSHCDILMIAALFSAQARLVRSRLFSAWLILKSTDKRHATLYRATCLRCGILTYYRHSKYVHDIFCHADYALVNRGVIAGIGESILLLILHFGHTAVTLLFPPRFIIADAHAVPLSFTIFVYFIYACWLFRWLFDIRLGFHYIAHEREQLLKFLPIILLKRQFHGSPRFDDMPRLFLQNAFDLMIDSLALS